MKTPSGLLKSVGNNQNKNNVLETREEFSINENLTIDTLEGLSVGYPIEKMYTVWEKIKKISKYFHCC